MIKNTFFVFLFWVCSGSTWSQIDVDSLYNFWDKEQTPQEVRLDELNRILSEDLPAVEQGTRLCVDYRFLAKESKDEFHIAKSLIYSGDYCYEQSKYDEAMAFYDESMIIATDLKDLKLIRSINNQITQIYLATGDMSKAADYQLENWELLKNSDDPTLKLSTGINLGAIFLKANNLEKSNEFLQSSLILCKAMQDTFRMGFCYNNLGGLKLVQEEWDEAYAYYDSSLYILQNHTKETSTKYKTSLAMCYINLSLSSLGKTDTLTARRYILDALDLSLENNNRALESKSLNILSNISKGDSALFLAKQALEIAQEIGSLDMIEVISRELHEKFKKLNRFHEAEEMSKLNSLAIRAFNDEEALAKLESYEKEQEELNKSGKIKEELSKNAGLIRKYSNLILFGSITFTILILLFALRYRKLNKNRKELLSQIEEFKQEKISAGQVSTVSQRDVFELDRQLIQSQVDSKLNESDWKILETLYENPAISNNALAGIVALSVEGTKSSLKKMYRIFEIPHSKNMKLALILIIIKMLRGGEA